ncbi:hypothetical protein GCM10009804_69580 [Kribbella hippodromi]|uniref:ArsR family transcriptional regulator n=2 Tax=Kribbella hippodromi TaxID=434347 RepID=A0ABN2ECB7_9ACTN
MAEDTYHPVTVTRSLLKMTAGSFSRNPLILTDQTAAKFLSEPSASRYFVPFLGREASAAVVAGELGVDVGSVTYRIKKMRDLGLLSCTRVEARAGRSIRYYRSAADSVFVPLELTPMVSIGELLRAGRQDSWNELEASLEAAWLRLGRDQGWGIHLYRQSNGAVNRDFVPRSLLANEQFWPAVLADSAPAVWDQHAAVHLTRPRAKQLQRRLSELISEYIEDPGQSELPPARYICHLALAPTIS